jgi:hypothetical protein
MVFLGFRRSAARQRNATRNGNAEKPARAALWPHRRAEGKSRRGDANKAVHDFVIDHPVTAPDLRRMTSCKAERFGRRARREPKLLENHCLI